MTKMDKYIEKIRPIDSSVHFYAATSGDSLRSYVNLMLDAVFNKVDELVETVNAIIDHIEKIENKLEAMDKSL